MHLFDAKQKMKHYNTPEEIIEEYIPLRLQFYTKRKKFMISELDRVVKILHNKARFIEEQCTDVIDLRKKNKQSVHLMLENRNYDTFDKKFDYLTSMPISSVIEESIIKLRNERDKNKKTLEKLRKMTEKKLWLNELRQFNQQYCKVIT
jgi:DNA topoisomerase-2